SWMGYCTPRPEPKSPPRTARSVLMAVRTKERPKHAPDTFLYRTPPLRDRTKRFRDTARAWCARDSAGRTVPGNRPAHSADHHGVQGRQATPSILLAIHVYSPDSSRDNLYLSNYTTLHVKDILARLEGVGDVQFQGGREYAMRIWLEPDKVAANNLNGSEVLV